MNGWCSMFQTGLLLLIECTGVSKGSYKRCIEVTIKYGFHLFDITSPDNSSIPLQALPLKYVSVPDWSSNKED